MVSHIVKALQEEAARPKDPRERDTLDRVGRTLAGIFTLCVGGGVAAFPITLMALGKMPMPTSNAEAIGATVGVGIALVAKTSSNILSSISYKDGPDANAIKNISTFDTVSFIKIGFAAIAGGVLGLGVNEMGNGARVTAELYKNSPIVSADTVVDRQVTFGELYCQESSYGGEAKAGAVDGNVRVACPASAGTAEPSSP